MLCGRFGALCLLIALVAPVAAAEGEWKVGLAKVAITPSQPTWLSGYSSRTQAADGKVHGLFAKAVAIEGADSTRLVLLTLDLGSVSPYMTERVSELTGKRFGLPRGSLVLNCSHTHCAPEVAAERPAPDPRGLEPGSPHSPRTSACPGR